MGSAAPQERRNLIMKILTGLVAILLAFAFAAGSAVAESPHCNRGSTELKTETKAGGRLSDETSACSSNRGGIDTSNTEKDKNKKTEGLTVRQSDGHRSIRSSLMGTLEAGAGGEADVGNRDRGLND